MCGLLLRVCLCCGRAARRPWCSGLGRGGCCCGAVASGPAGQPQAGPPGWPAGEGLSRASVHPHAPWCRGPGQCVRVPPTSWAWPRGGTSLECVCAVWAAGAPGPETPFPACAWPEPPAPPGRPSARELGRRPRPGSSPSLFRVAVHAPRALRLFVVVLGQLSPTVTPSAVGLRVQAPAAPGCPACSLLPGPRSALPPAPRPEPEVRGPRGGTRWTKGPLWPGRPGPLSVSPSPLSQVAPPGSCWRWILVCVPARAVAPLLWAQERGPGGPGPCRAGPAAAPWP